MSSAMSKCHEKDGQRVAQSLSGTMGCAIKGAMVSSSAMSSTVMDVGPCELCEGVRDACGYSALGVGEFAERPWLLTCLFSTARHRA